MVSLGLLVGRGEEPASCVFALQYVSPGLNGNPLLSNSDTARPHAVGEYQTLFSPARSISDDDGACRPDDERLN